MARYVGQRLIQLFIVLFVVTFLVAIALRLLPGGADVVVALKTGPGATPEQAAQVKQRPRTSIAASRSSTSTGCSDLVTRRLGQHVPDQPAHP